MSMIGKTISETKNINGTIYVKFTDSTWIVFEAAYSHVSTAELELNDHTNYTLVNLGIITEEVFNEAVEERRLAVRAAVKQVQKDRLDRLANEELELYERLKLKYK